MIGLVYYHDSEKDNASHTQWEYLTRNMGLDRLYVICPEEDRDDFIKKYKVIFSSKCGEKQIVSSLSDIIDQHPDHKFMYMVPFSVVGAKQHEWIHKFEHPKSDVFYVIGRDDTGIPESDINVRDEDKILCIDGVTNIVLEGQDTRYQDFFAFTAANIVVCDRFVKSKLGT
jgi:hypothetical protein